MERLEFILNTKEAVEKFKEALETRVPSELKKEDWHYSNEKHKIDFYHVTFQKKGLRAGTYSYELAPNGTYICVLDLREMPEISVGIPGKTLSSNTFEFHTDEPKFLHLMKNGIAEELQKRGFELRPTTGRNYQAFSFMHQAIAKDTELVARYDFERDGKNYICHFDSKLTREDYEKIKDLLQEWTKSLFK